MYLYLTGLQQGRFSQFSSLPCKDVCLNPAEYRYIEREFHTGKLMWGGSSDRSVAGGDGVRPSRKKGQCEGNCSESKPTWSSPFCQE